jgi:anti-sigma regulatory factor (Ser/Thr protein kinase)
MRLLDLHGRGILITRAYFDSVSYNDKGNEVMLTKAFGDILEEEAAEAE